MSIRFSDIGGNTILRAVYVQTDITAQVNTRYLVNTTAQEITINLPDEPNVGDQVEIIDAIGDGSTTGGEGFGKFACVLSPATGHDIQGVENNLILDIDSTTVSLIFDGVNSWIYYILNVNKYDQNFLEDTDDVPEGQTNLYFTNARVDTRLSQLTLTAIGNVDTNTNLPEELDVLTWDSNVNRWVPKRPIPISTDVIPEGTTNVFHTQQRVIDSLGSVNISDLQDVSYLFPEEKSFLRWNGLNWSNKNWSEALWDNNNFALDLVTFDIPQFDGSKWVPISPAELAGGGINLSDLANVSNAAAGDKELTLYNSTSGIWEFGTLQTVASENNFGLDGLVDVSITSAQDNELLFFQSGTAVNGSLNNLAGASLNLSDLKDIDFSFDDTQAQIISWNPISNLWEANNQSQFASTFNDSFSLSNLGDVSSAPVDKTILQYNSASGLWDPVSTSAIISSDITASIDESVIKPFIQNTDVGELRDVGDRGDPEDVLILKEGTRDDKQNREQRGEVNSSDKYLVVFHQGSGLWVARQGPTGNQVDSFDIALSAVPDSPVKVDVINGNPSEFDISESSVILSDTSPSTVTVTARGDNIGSGDTVGSITLQVDNANSDPDFASLSNVLTVDVFEHFFVWQSSPVSELNINLIDLKDSTAVQAVDQQIIEAREQSLRTDLSLTSQTVANVEFSWRGPQPTVGRGGIVSDWIDVVLTSSDTLTITLTNSTFGLNETLEFTPLNWDLPQRVYFNASSLALTGNDSTETITVSGDISTSIDITVVDRILSFDPTNAKDTVIPVEEGSGLVTWQEDDIGLANTTTTSGSITLERTGIINRASGGRSDLVIAISLEQKPTEDLTLSLFAESSSLSTITIPVNKWKFKRYVAVDNSKNLAAGTYRFACWVDPNTHTDLTYSGQRATIEYSIVDVPLILKPNSGDLLSIHQIKEANLGTPTLNDINIWAEPQRPQPYAVVWQSLSIGGVRLSVITTAVEEGLYLTRTGNTSYGNTQDYFDVALDADPGGALTVTIELPNNDGTLSLSTTNLNFNSTNWSRYQRVTLSATGSGSSSSQRVWIYSGDRFVNLTYRIKESLVYWDSRSASQVISDNFTDYPGNGNLIVEEQWNPYDNSLPFVRYLNSDDSNVKRTPLQLVSVYPNDGSTIHPEFGYLVVEFNRNIWDSAGRLLVNGEETSFLISGRFLYTNLSVSTGNTYTVTLEADAVRGEDNIANAPETLCQFDVALVSANAVIVNQSPSDNAANIAPDEVIKLFFNRAILLKEGVIEVRRADDNSVVESFTFNSPSGDISGSAGGTLSLDLNVLTITPGAATLVPGAELYVNYSEGAIVEGIYNLTLDDNGTTYNLVYDDAGTTTNLLVGEPVTAVTDQSISFTVRPNGSIILTQPSQRVVVARGGTYTTNTFSVKTDVVPASDITIDVISLDTGQVLVSPASLTINTGNYNVDQDFTITAVANGLKVQSQANILLTATSTDERFDGIEWWVTIIVEPVIKERFNKTLYDIDYNLDAATDVNYNSLSENDILLRVGSSWESRSLEQSVLDNVNLIDFIPPDNSPTHIRRHDKMIVVSGGQFVFRDIHLYDFSTSNLSEGSNLYFTNWRVDNRISSHTELGYLSNVDTSAKVDNSVITYDAGTSTWIASGLTLPESTDDLPEGTTNLYLSSTNLETFALSDLGDVNYGTPTDKAILTWVAAESSWKALDFSQINISIRSLAEVRDTAAADNEVLTWNQTNGWYEPKPLGEVVDSLTTDDIGEGTTNKYYASSLFDSDFDDRIISVHIETLGNVSSGATSGQYLRFNGTEWIPFDLTFSISGKNISGVNTSNLVGDLNFDDSSGLYLSDDGDGTATVSFAFSDWNAVGDLITTNNGVDSFVLPRGAAGDVLTVNGDDTLVWSPPEPPLLRIKTLSADYTLLNSDNYTLFRINDNTVLSLPDNLDEGFHIRARILTANVTLTFNTIGSSIIVTTVPQVDQLNDEVTLIYEGLNSSNEAEWSIRKEITSSSNATGTTVKASTASSNFVAASFSSYPVNTTGGSITATLPSSPSDGDKIEFYDVAGVNPGSANYPAGFANNSFFIIPGSGDTVVGETGLTLQEDNASILLQYDQANNNWNMIGGLNALTAIVPAPKVEQVLVYEYQNDYLEKVPLFYNSFINQTLSRNLINQASGSNLTETLNKQVLKATDQGVKIRINTSSSATNEHLLTLPAASVTDFTIIFTISTFGTFTNDFSFLKVFGHEFGIDSNSRLFSKHSSGYNFTQVVPNTMTVAYVISSGSNSSLYFNGVLKSTQLETPTSASDDLIVGALDHSGDSGAGVIIRDLALFLSHLSSTQILDV